MKSKTLALFLALVASRGLLAADGPTEELPAIPMAPPAAGLPAYPAITKKETPEEHAARLKWFREARFGMFIHWGVYAVAAGWWQGRPAGAEWIMNRAKIPVAEYRPLASQKSAILIS